MTVHLTSGRWVRAAAVAGLTAIGVTACASSPSGTAAAPAPGNDVGTQFDVGLPANLTALPFRTSDGRTVTLDSLHGKVVVLSDVMTLCQETCPLDTAALVETARETDAAHGKGGGTVFLSLTVDPQRDTPAQLAAYRKLFNPPPTNWLALTGTPADVNAVWNHLGVWRQRVAERAGPPPTNWRTGAVLSYDIEHSDEVFFLDREGHERFILEGPPHVSTGQVPSALYGFMNAQGRSGLASPPATNWTVPQARQVVSWLDGTTGG